VGSPTDTAADRADRRFGRIGLAVLAVLAAVTTVGAFTTLEFGDLARPAPGFWVGCVSAATLGLVVTALVNPSIVVAEIARITRADATAVAIAVPLLVLMPPMLTVLGLTITTAVTCLYWFALVTRTTPLRSVVGAIAITVGIELVFIELLHVPFPLGSLTGIR
jgi:Tripartite tricarboxylate transporter TctB family